MENFDRATPPSALLLCNEYRVVRGCHLGRVLSQFGATSNKIALAFDRKSASHKGGMEEA
jgi:hypothetical protein